MSRKLALAEVLFAIVLFIFAGRSPLIDELSDSNLAFHMVAQHVLLFIPGLVLGAQLSRLMKPGGPLGILFTILAVALTAFWHIPIYWDLAAQNELPHLLEHLSFFLSGMLVYISLTSLGKALKWIFLIVYLVASSILAANTIGIRHIFQSSPVPQHTQLAVYMVVTMPLFFLLIVLSSVYMPGLAEFWAKRRLSLWGSGVLVILFLLAILVF